MRMRLRYVAILLLVHWCVIAFLCVQLYGMRQRFYRLSGRYAVSDWCCSVVLNECLGTGTVVSSRLRRMLSGEVSRMELERCLSDYSLLRVRLRSVYDVVLRADWGW